MLAFAARSPAARASPGDSTLLLEVLINGRDTHKLADFIERTEDGAPTPPASRPAGKRRIALYATRSDLRDLGLHVPASPGQSDHDLVRLSSLKGVVCRLDGPTQTLDIRATDEALAAARLDDQAPPPPPLRTGSGGVLNYDATETFADGRLALRGLLDARLFTQGGVLDTQYLLAAGTDAAATRLDSTFSYADPNTLRTYRAGDIITGGLAWSRPVRIGGLQVQTDFSIRPDLVTFPLPQIGGSATVPSTVDVLINNVRLLSRNVDPGPFALTQLPIVSGANTVTVVTTNALGQQSTQTLPFYTTSRLLTPGLASYSAELGAIRNGYGARSDEYGQLAGSATMRYGVWRLVTLEAHGEACPGLGAGGGGAVVNLGGFGVLTTAIAASARSGHDGILVSAGLERVTRLLTLSASVQSASPSYGDLGSAAGNPVPRQQIRASAGFALGRAGTINLSYTASMSKPISNANARADDGVSQLVTGFERTTTDLAAAQPVRAALLSVTYTARIWGGIEGYSTGFHDFAQAGSTGMVIGLSLPLGLRRSASVSAGLSGGQAYLTEQASQTAVEPGEIGGTMLNQNGAQTRQMIQADAATAFGDLDAGLDHDGHSIAWRAEQSGALAVIDDSVFASRTIQDSFAVVDTGLPHVNVLQENRPAGTTGATGQVLLPNLQSYASNHIGIDPASIPADADLRSATDVVRPQSRTGVVVRFKLRNGASAILHLLDEQGAALPVGSVAVLQPGGAPNVIGYDGIAFLHDLKPHNTIKVTRADGKVCMAAFDFRPRANSLPNLGKLTCRGTAAR